ncbi:MAG: hypothetical protein RLZZ282_1237 [Verrucomicrobiota bacterium]|jgi:hypothetical protein
MDLPLHRNRFGQLVFTTTEGIEHVDVEPARAFPITAPREEIALLSRDGHELAWIPKLDDLPQATCQLVEEALERREFMPEIQKVRAVSGYATPCTWQVDTDRGPTSLVLKAEEDIRRLSASTLLIVDSRGIQFLIRNPASLDPTSRKILDRFL